MKKMLREYFKTSRAMIPKGLNKAAKNATFRAIKLTPKTPLARITHDVGTPSNPKPIAFGIYKLGHPGVKATLDRVVRMIKSKRSSIAYIAAGFIRALRAFGVARKDVNPRSIAARGRGKKAITPSDYSEILNTAPGADYQATGALARGAKEGVQDMIDYANRQQAIAAQKFNNP